MLDLASWAEAFLVAFVLTAPYVAWLRPTPLAFALGAVVVAVLALLLELAIQSALMPVTAGLVVLVLVGPLVEELLKFGASGATGATYRSAAGAGIGFAATENALYFAAFWGEPLTYLATLVVVRAVTDPLLHSTATTLTTLTLRGRPWGLPAGLTLHILWNSGTVVAGLLDPAGGLVLLAANTTAVLGVMLLMRRSPGVEADLAPDESGRPSRGMFTSAG